MGDGPSPKSTDSGDGDTGGLGDIDRYGVGERDPVTGLYENYDFPAGHPATQEVDTETPPITWPAIFGQAELIEADFRSEYQLELTQVYRTATWRWFRVRVQGLLYADTRLSRHFRPNN